MHLACPVSPLDEPPSVQTRDSFCPADCSFTGEHQTSFCPSTNHRPTHTRTHSAASTLIRPRFDWNRGSIRARFPLRSSEACIFSPFRCSALSFRRSIALFFGISAVTQPRAEAGAARLQLRLFRDERLNQIKRERSARHTHSHLTHSPGLGMSAPYRLERLHANEKIAERMAQKREGEANE